MKLSHILSSTLLLIGFFTVGFADAVLDVAKPEININQKNKRDYIPLTNIGDESGTFTVQVKNITDPQHVITYSNKELRSLPVIISPLLIRNLGSGNNKRISVRKKGKVETPMKLQLVISEYKNTMNTKTEVAANAAGIDVQGAIHYVTNIDLS